MLKKITLARAAGVALMVGGCGTTAPDSGDVPVGTPAPEGSITTETATPLELPEGQRLSAAVRTDTSTLYFIAAPSGINLLEVGEMSQFEPILARVAAPASALEIYLTLTARPENEAPEELLADHYGARDSAPRAAQISPTSVLQDRALETFAGATSVEVPGMGDVRPDGALIDKAAPQRLAFSVASGAPADCSGLGAFFLAYYGHISVTGLEPTFAGCDAPNVCFTNGNATSSKSGIGSFRTAAGCNGKPGSATIIIMTDKNAPFCPSCPPALPYRGPLFSLRSGSSFLYVETGGDFAGSMSVTGSASGAGTLATIALH